MKAIKLLSKASKLWEEETIVLPSLNYNTKFEFGAAWMSVWMGKIRPEAQIFLKPLFRFSYFGYLKYGLSLIFMGISIPFLYKIHAYLVVFSVLVFYLVEVHFLFLFPILIENKENPIKQSIKITYKIGLFSALITVIPIAFFMLIGLFNIKNPLKNWYIGCLSVLIWYEEVSIRI
jgi:hypothetical protein